MGFLKFFRLNKAERRDVFIKGLSSVAAASIVAAAGWVIAKKTDWFPVLGQYSLLPVTVSLWVLVAGGLLLSFQALAVLGGLFKPVYKRSYRSDVISNIKWRWDYGQQGLENLKPYCVKCDTELMLRPKDPSKLPTAEQVAEIFRGTEVYCTSCNSGFGITNALDVPDHIRRVIEKNLRDGSWRSKTKAG